MGRLSRACLGVIDRYQASEVAHAVDGRCRFDPSCCAFMREAFATRSFPVAWLMSAWRVVRCNPLTRPRSADPLVRASRARPRPSALRTAFASMLLAGTVTLLIGGAAGAQTIQGPCTGMVNGRHPATMTRSNPLVVTRGQQVSVTGTLQGANADTKSVTTIQVDFISGVWSKKELRQGNGPTWGGAVSVDAYTSTLSGLYRVHGNARAPGIFCIGDGYIRLDGGGLVTAIGGGVAGIGLIGSVGSPGIQRVNPDPSKIVPDGPSARPGTTMSDLGNALDDDIRRNIPGIDPPTKTVVKPVRRVTGSCCMLSVLALPFLFAGMGGPGATPAAGTVLAERHVWKRGHPILGFFSGLLLGLGGSVVLQQRAVWVLDIWTAIVLPVGLAILVAVRAWIGRPYAIRKVVA